MVFDENQAISHFGQQNRWCGGCAAGCGSATRETMKELRKPNSPPKSGGEVAKPGWFPTRRRSAGEPPRLAPVGPPPDLGGERVQKHDGDVRAQMVESLHRYEELYDLAPVSFLTL